MIRSESRSSYMSYLVRFIHVGSASFLVGATTLLLILLLLSKVRGDHEHDRWLLELMAAYEWGFWVCIGLIAATGLGNVGAFHDGLPEPDSEWGRDFTVKLSI